MAAVLCYAVTHRAVLAVTTAHDTTHTPTTPRPATHRAATHVSARPGGRDANLLGLAAPGLGGLTAAALTIHPLLVVLALPAVHCLHLAVLAHHLEHAGRVNPKTGLFTAAAWHTQALRAIQRRDPGDPRWAVLVIDLDHFKHVNDTHGHLAGDTVLVAIADALRAEVRDTDIVGRFGGDEFVVLLTGHHRRCDGDRLRVVAERIRRRIAALQIEIDAPTPHDLLTLTGLSASIGGVSLPDHHRPDLRTLFQLADTALYAAKHAGRDTVRIATHPTPPDGESQTWPLPGPGTQG